MIQFITDRTNADVIRAKEINKKVYDACSSVAENATDSSAVIDPVQIAESALTDQEFTEWLAGLKGAYNYSDLNRVESAVEELSKFLELGLNTKTNWGMLDVPTQADMRRYISNLLKVKDRYSASVQIQDSGNGFTYESANNIEKMLTEACAVMDTSDVWKKFDANVTYSWVYIRDDDNAIIGTKGVGTIEEIVWVMGDGTHKVQSGFPSNSTIYFSSSRGFYLNNNSPYDYFPPGASAIGRYVGNGTECRKVTALLEESWVGSYYPPDPTLYEYREYTYEYEVVGYATKEWTPSCKNLGTNLVYTYFPKGEIPKGTLIKGSYAEGFCYVQENDGKYYYYELR